METTIKEIIAPFLGMEPVEVGPQTPLNRNTLKSSIHLHRMYAKLNSNGFGIDDYSNISTFGDLLNKLHVNTLVGTSTPLVSFNTNDMSQQSNVHIGIDVEDITSMPETSDFRNHEFYSENFTASEISYCVLQQNPYASFAGLFAAKEALIKSNYTFAVLPFNTIQIDHNEKGKPTFKDYAISISHTGHLAIAVVLSPINNEGISNDVLANQAVTGNSKTSIVLSILAILLSVFTILVMLFKK